MSELVLHIIQVRHMPLRLSSIRRTPAAAHNAARARSLLASFDAQAATPSTQAIPAFVTIFCFGGLPH